MHKERAIAVSFGGDDKASTRFYFLLIGLHGQGILPKVIWILNIKCYNLNNCHIFLTFINTSIAEYGQK